MMYVYLDDLDAMLAQLIETGVTVLRGAKDMPWCEKIATVADPEGNPGAPCQAK